MFLLLAVASPCAIANAAGGPAWPPRVPGVDQSPSSDTKEYGKCTQHVQRELRAGSHWCRFGRLGSWPELPNVAARKTMKFGRLTTFNGPILKQKLACNVSGIGSNTHAAVAVSTRYLKTWQGGWAADKGACGKCMCITLFGGDDQYNKGLQRWVVKKHRGVTFAGRVADRMSEGADQSIDILLDRPFAYAPVVPVNPNAAKVNALSGVRAFPARDAASPEYPIAVGTWTALWQFVPCSWDHARCARALRRATGYDTRVPRNTTGI